MSLVRAWARQLFGASGVALVVPGAVALALVALAAAGGFGQLGDLSQTFAGPAAPASVRVPGVNADHRGTAAAPVLPAALAAAPPAAAGGATGGGGRKQATSTGGNPRAGIGPIVTTGPTSGSAGNSPGTGTGPSGGGSAPVGTGGGPTLVDGVVSVGTKVTSQLPGPVGPTATGLLQSVGKSVDSLLPATGAQTATALSTVQTTVAGAAASLVPGVPLP